MNKNTVNAVPKPKHARRIPKRVDIGKFDKKTRERIIERDEGLCRQCGGVGHHIHHVFLKSQLGEGIFSNGILVCGTCHDRIHKDYKLIRYWQEVFAGIYGKDYWKGNKNE